jgi:transposase-like protein
MTQTQLDEIRSAYEAWNPYAPDAETAEQLAERFGITKTTMYTWRRRGWNLNGRDGDGQEGWKARGESSPVIDPAVGTGGQLVDTVRYLTEQLVALTAENAELKKEIDGYLMGNGHKS